MENTEDSTQQQVVDEQNNENLVNQQAEQQEQNIEYSKEEKLKNCLQILRKFPISSIKKVVEALTSLVYENDELLNEFLQKIDQPSEISKEDIKGEFLTCEYNRDGDYYRSNVSNSYFPSPEEGEELRFPTKEVREMEVSFNKIFKEYTKLYFGGGAISSVYCWELGSAVEEGICVAVIIKNLVDNTKGVKGGCWDSSHLIVINFDNNDGKIEAKYKLTSTIFFSASINHKVGEIDFSGSTTRLSESSKGVENYIDVQKHINVIGEMIENSESEIRRTIEERNIKKSQEIIDTCRYSPVIGKPNIEGANKLKEVFKGK